MPLALSIQDSQDGSGALATIAGSDPGLNTIYCSIPFAQGVAPPSWTATATLSGNGTVQLPVGPGYYFAYVSGAVGGLPALSAPVPFTATLDVLAIQSQVELAIQAKIQVLTLAGLTAPPGNLPPGHVYRFGAILPTMVGSVIQMPAVVVSPAPIGETIAGQTNTDDVGYPVTVTILGRQSPQDTVSPDTYELWRQQIFRAIRNQRLPGVDHVGKVEASMHAKGQGAVLAWQPPTFEYLYSTLTFVAVNREPRGVGA